MKTKALKETEVELILNQLNQLRDQCLFILGLKTGFRISELLSLTVADVQLNGKINQFLTIRRNQMKGKYKARTVPLHQEAQRYLGLYLDSLQVKSGKLFPMSRMQAHRVLKEAARRAGIEGVVSTHSMRKTFGMNVYNRTGKDVVAAQMALGHASLQSTGHYLSVGEEEVNQAILA